MKFMKMKYIIVAVILILLGAGVLGAETIIMAPVAFESESGPAPDFVLRGLDSDVISLSDYKDKNEVILFFWNTECRLCRDELIELNRIYETIEAEGIRLVSINTGERKSTVERYLSNLGIRFPVYMDINYYVVSLYSIQGVPTFVFVNKEGDIISRRYRFPRDYKDILMEQER